MTEYLETLQLIRTVKLQLKEHFTINQSVIEGNFFSKEKG